MSRKAVVAMVHASTGDHRSFAEEAVGRLRMALRDPHMSWKDVGRNIIIVDNLRYSADFYEALLEADVVPAVAKAFNRLVSTTDETSNDFVPVAQRAIVFLKSVFYEQDGFKYLARTVKVGALKAIYVACANMDALNRLQELPHFLALLRILPKYLIYRDVLEAVKPFIDRNLKQFRRKIANSQAALAQWDAFHARAEDRLDILDDLIDQEMLERYHLVCENPQVKDLSDPSRWY